jgi:predicted methyltransferase
VAVKAIAADPAYSNVTVLHAPVNRFSVPEPLDLVWTSMNYHDLHLEFFGPADLAAVNKAIFAALKPGGIYLVLDHAAAAGSGLRDAGTLHRIDPEVVKREVLAAGFVLDAESDALRNPADDHSRKVFDEAVRGKTDKFIFRFRKPAK